MLKADANNVSDAIREAYNKKGHITRGIVYGKNHDKVNDISLIPNYAKDESFIQKPRPTMGLFMELKKLKNEDNSILNSVHDG